MRYRSNSALSFAVGCNAFRYSEKDNGSILSSTYRPVKWMILRFFQNRPVKWMIFAEWVSDIDVRLGKSEVMLRSFDEIHECVWPLTCLIHFSQLIGRNTYHSSKTRALI